MVSESTNRLGRGAAIALAVAIPISWCWLAALSAASIARDQESLKAMAIPGSDPAAIDPRIEGAKSATLVMLPFLLGLAVALRLRDKGWRGVAISGLTVFGALWLLTGLIFGDWTFFRILPLAATVAALPAGDLLALGKDRRIRSLLCVGLSSTAFLIAAILQFLLWVLLHPPRSGMRPPLFFIHSGVAAFLHGYPPWLPLILAWTLTIPRSLRSSPP